MHLNYDLELNDICGKALIEKLITRKDENTMIQCKNKIDVLTLMWEQSRPVIPRRLNSQLHKALNEKNVTLFTRYLLGYEITEKQWEHYICSSCQVHGVRLIRILFDHKPYCSSCCNVTWYTHYIFDGTQLNSKPAGAITHNELDWWLTLPTTKKTSQI